MLSAGWGPVGAELHRKAGGSTSAVILGSWREGVCVERPLRAQGLGSDRPGFEFWISDRATS